MCLLQNPHLLRPGCSLVRLSSSRSAIHLKAPPPSLHRDDHLSVLPPPSPLSRLRPASSVFGRRRCTPPRWPPLTEPHTANYDVKHNTRGTRPYGSHVQTALATYLVSRQNTNTSPLSPSATSLLCVLHLLCFQAAAIAAAIDLALGDGDGCTCAACWPSLGSVCSSAAC